MTINKNSWHYKWFMKYVINKYTSNGTYPIAEDSFMIGCECGTLTLCTYVKAVLIYAPIRYVWTNRISRLTMINIGILLVIWAELVSPAFNAGMCYLIEVLILASIILGFILFWAFYEEQIKAKAKHTSEKVKNTSFISILKGYYKAKKEKVCPFIKFED